MPEAVAVIVFSADRSQILLTKRRDIPVWVLPGGGIEHGETPEAAAVRELEEEILCASKIVKKIADYQKVNMLTQRTHFYECSIQGDPLVSAETEDVRFFPYDQLPHLPPPYTYWIKDALAHRGDVLNKPIEGVSLGMFLQLLIKHPLIVLRFLLSRIGIHFNT